MNQLKFCKICLITGVKFYNQDEFNLQKYYEDIMGSTYSNCQYSTYFCYECSALLYKTNKFKLKCDTGQRILKYLSDIGPITQNSLYGISRKQHKLDSTLSNLISTNRVVVFHYQEDFTISDNQNSNVDYEITIKEEPELNVFTSTFDIIQKEEVSIPEIKESPYCSEDETHLSDSVHFELSQTEEAGNKMKKKSIKNNAREKKKKVAKTTKKAKKEKVKFAKQKAAGKKFDPNKWKIVLLSEDEMYKEFHEKGDKNYRNSLYYCENCLKVFISDETLQRHMKVHSEDKGKHECKLCKRRFHHGAKLRSHLKTHQMRYHCLLCPEVLRTAYTATIHEKMHEGVIYECQQCDAKFVKRTSYYTHVRERHRSEYICSVCGAPFISKHGVNQHQKTKHPELSLQIEKEIVNEEVYCSVCDITFSTEQAYVMHKKTSSKHDDHENDSVAEKEKLVEILNCDQCDAVFTSKNGIAKHISKMHKKKIELKRWVCEICGVSLAISSIKIHMNRHLNSQVYPCKTCGKTFKSTSEIKRHIRKHTGERPYFCKVCEKKFASRQAVRKHHDKYHHK